MCNIIHAICAIYAIGTSYDLERRGGVGEKEREKGRRGEEARGKV